MLLYERLKEDIIKVKLEPNTYWLMDIDNPDNNILLNYYIPEYEMSVYRQLTKNNMNAFEKVKKYNFPSSEWVHCNSGTDITNCFRFNELELIKIEENIHYYKYRNMNFLPNIYDPIVNN